MSPPRREVIGDAELWLGDMREIVPALVGVDHVITDPPYEDDLHEAIGRIQRTDGHAMPKTFGFDGINADRAEVARLLKAASAGWAVVFCLAEGVRAWRDELQAAGARYDTCLAWVKPDASPRFNGQGAARGFECAVTVWCGKGHRRWNGGGRRGVFVHPVNVGRQGEHPTEKPLPLMMDLVSLYTDHGQNLCDPYAGSGTTGVACVRLGRRFVGVERDPRWFDLACRRIEAAHRQADLFVERPPKPEQASLFPRAVAAVAALALLAVASAPASAATYYGQKAPGAGLPGAQACADGAYAAAGTGEARPDNATANLSTGKGTFSGHVDGTDTDARYGARVQGNSSLSSGAKLATTKQLLTWGACKWGLDQDVTYARAVQESYWHQSQLGDQTSSSSACASFGKTAPCWQSYGILQVKASVHETTYPMSQNKTPFNIDYALAWQRACYDGDFTWLGNGYAAGDMWGCVGAWFSGNWHDAGAETYIAQVKSIVSDRTWEKAGF